MKIKDVISEGILDYAKGLVKTRSIAGAKAAHAQGVATKAVQPFVNAVINKWNEYVALNKKNTAADAINWAQGVFKDELQDIDPPKNNTPAEINRFLTDASHSYKAGNYAKATTSSYVSPLGVKLTQGSDPVTVTYKNKNFMLNDTGHWAIDGKSNAASIASQSLAAEMEKVAKSALGT